jgi:pimeloyl-ACP methyl ester carboxylesterase
VNSIFIGIVVALVAIGVYAGMGVFLIGSLERSNLFVIAALSFLVVSLVGFIFLPPSSSIFESAAQGFENFPRHGQLSKHITLRWRYLALRHITSSGPPDERIFFFPGWMMDAVTSGSLQPLAVCYARKTDLPVQIISTTGGPLDEQSAAAASFISSTCVRKAILIGHSEGGIRASRTAVALQERYPSIEIEGVILLNSVGLMTRPLFGLIVRFIEDFGRTGPAIVWDRLLRGDRGMPGRLEIAVFAGLDILAGIIFNTPVGRNRRLRKSPVELARHNPALGEITAPVILLHTTGDITSMDEVLVHALISLDQPDGAQLRISRSAKSRARKLIKDMSLEEKGSLLQRTLLPRSEYVRLIISEGTHSYPLQYPKQTAELTITALRSDSAH